MGGRFAYVSCAEPREIAIWRLGEPGAQPAAVSAGSVAIPGLDAPSSSSPLAVGPGGRMLYAALREPPHPVTSYAIDPETGGLGARGTAPMPASMAAIAVDGTGRWLAGASYGEAVVSVQPIAADGVVRVDGAPQVAPTPPKAHSVLWAPDNRFLYAACLGGDVILGWAFDAQAGLVAPDRPVATPVRSGAGPRHIRFANGMLYVVCELDGTVDVFAHDAAGGGLEHRQTVQAFAGDGGAAAAELRLTPDGRFLYASVRADSTMAVFAVDQGRGTLSLVERVAVETTPRGFAVDPAGGLLVCAARDGACFGVHAIEPATGRLTLLERHATGGNPNWVEIVDLG